MLLTFVIATTVLAHSISLLSAVYRHKVSERIQDDIRPIRKILNLLKDMRENIDSESSRDETSFKKMSCWCKTNRDEKTLEINDGEEAVKQCNANIEQYGAESARLLSEISDLGKYIEDKERSIDQQVAIRASALNAFHKEEVDLVGSIRALSDAIEILKRHNAASPNARRTQSEEEVKSSAATLLQNFLSAHTFSLPQYASPIAESSANADGYRLLSVRNRIEGVLTQLREPLSVSAPQNEYFGERAIGQKEDYSGQSGEVFGTLNQMLDDFQQDLVTARKEEAQSLRSHLELKASMEKELAEAKKSLGSKSDQKATGDENLRNNKQNLIDESRELEARKNYIANLEEICAKSQSEYASRTNTRALELKGINAALKILDSDSARDLFSANFAAEQKKSTSLIQLMDRTPITRAARILSKHPHLASIALMLRNKARAPDFFSKVIASIDMMIVDLRKQNAQDSESRDFCVNELHNNENSILSETGKKKLTEAEISTLEETVKRLSEEISLSQKQISDIETSIQSAGEIRSDENRDFQTEIQMADQTVMILNRALTVLREIYSKTPPPESDGPSFIQQIPVGPEAPEAMEKFEKQDSGILYIMEDLIKQTLNGKQEAITAEQTMQESYEQSVQDSNKERKNIEETITSKSLQKADTERTLNDQDKLYRATAEELQNLLQTQKDIRTKCDFLINNYTTIQNGRNDEVDALVTAKSILKGSK